MNWNLLYWWHYWYSCSFNARKKAKCFAGDVGSVTIAVIVCFLLVQRIVVTGDYKYLAFVALYLVDTGLTIIQRAKNGEKVLEAHRKHLFQVLSNEKKLPHLVVAIAYAVLQLGINMALVNTEMSVASIVGLFALCIAIYIPVKVCPVEKGRVEQLLRLSPEELPKYHPKAYRDIERMLASPLRNFYTGISHGHHLIIYPAYFVAKYKGNFLSCIY